MYNIYSSIVLYFLVNFIYVSLCSVMINLLFILLLYLSIKSH